MFPRRLRCRDHHIRAPQAPPWAPLLLREDGGVLTLDVLGL